MPVETVSMGTRVIKRRQKNESEKLAKGGWGGEKEGMGTKGRNGPNKVCIYE
jgi:hypothetical protein